MSFDWLKEFHQSTEKGAHRRPHLRLPTCGYDGRYPCVYRPVMAYEPKFED